MRSLVRTALVALALLALGEAAPAAFPVRVAVEAMPDGALTLEIDGDRRPLPSTRSPGWSRVVLREPGPAEREYQVDGTDRTATQDRDGAFIAAIQGTPLYRAAAWLRDEDGYSRWADLRLLDRATGRTLADGRAAVQGFSGPLPAAFRLEAALRRPEAPAALWLATADGTTGQGVELSRDRRDARWLVRANGREQEAEAARRFFPENPLPFGAMLLQLVGRSAAAGLLLFVGGAAALGAPFAVAPAGLGRVPWPEPALRRAAGVLAAVLPTVWLLAAAWVAARLYRQLPHVLDAVSYVFQAQVLRAGRVALDAPPLVEALKGPFQVVRDGRWFSQYPPGAPAAYALGDLVGLMWLVGPASGLLLILASAAAARALYDDQGLGWAVLGLGLISPFLLFQAGSFLSHPVAGALLAGALWAFARGERAGRGAWYAVAGSLLGAAFTARETSSALYGALLGGWLALHGRWRAIGLLALGALPFGLLYLAYNQALTGSPLVLPRALFAGNDRFGFGDGIGFYNRHTPAAGLANADEQLTLLQFDLFGWPPLFALGLPLLPFLLRRPDRRDLLLGAGVLAFVAAFVAYFYHGIVLGPRYYFEALPLLLPLCGRGLQVAARALTALGLAPSAARVGAALAAGLLTLNTLAFYLPRQVERRTDYVAFPDGRRLALPWVENGLFGPRVADGAVAAPALVLANDWWLFSVVLAPLNCGRPDLARDPAACPRLFALATTRADEDRLRAAYPGRTLLRAVQRDGTVVLEPG